MRSVLSVLLGSLVLVVVAPSLAAAAGEPGAITPAGSAILGVAPAGTGGDTVAVGAADSSTVLVQRFAASGAAGARIAAGPGIGRAVVVQPDGRIVVVGSGSPAAGSSDASNGFVRRFNADGSPDAGFAAVTLRDVQPNAVALGTKGTIVIAGSVPGSDRFTRISVTRLTSAGGPDSSFASNGSAVIDLGTGSEARAVAVQPDGLILIAGQQRPGLQITNALIARVRADGSLDPSFNGGNQFFYFHPQGGANSSLNALSLDGSGRIVAAGIDVRDNGNFALFVRLTADGRPDASFGANGIQSAPASTNYSGGQQIGPRAIAVAGSGRIAVAGGFQDSGLRSAALWVLTSAGQLDAAAGTGGRVTTLPAEGGGEAFGLAVTPDGTLFAGGVATNPPSTTGYVQRFAGFGPPPNTPAPGGGAGGTGNGNGGGTGGGSGGGTPSSAFPVFGRVTLSTRTIRPGTSSVLSFALSAPGKVSVRLRMRRAGRKSGGRCLRTTKRVARSKRCSVFVSLHGRRLLTVKAGVNRIRVNRKFGGRILRSGSYRFRLRATGGAFRNIGFRVRPRHR